MLKMIIYEINMTVDKEAESDFREWLPNHIREILALVGFQSAEIFTRQADGNEDGETKWLCTVQYRLVNQAALDDYFQNKAAEMRKDGTARFGGRFTATRRILQHEGSF